MAVAVRHVVEVARLVDGLGLLTRHPALLEQEELDLGVGVEGEPEVGGLGERPLQHVPRVGHARGAVGEREVAEHPGRSGALAAPRQHLEGARVGLGEHVGLVDAGEALDDRAVEADPLGEGPLELGRCDGDGLQGAEHVGEPEPDETDVALFDGAEDELLLTVHDPNPAAPVCPAGNAPPRVRHPNICGPASVLQWARQRSGRHTIRAMSESTPTTPAAATARPGARPRGHGALRHRRPGRAAAAGPRAAPAPDEGARREVGDAHGLRHVHGRDLRRGRHPRPARRRQRRQQRLRLRDHGPGDRRPPRAADPCGDERGEAGHGRRATCPSAPTRPARSRRWRRRPAS